MSGLLQTASGAASEQIFGRKKELKIISEALSRSDNSGTFLLAVEGQAGIGKTSIILKALENYPHKKCFRLYGKFENHRENTPYAAFRQAFALWSQQILLLPDAEFDALKESSTSALQTNIAAITDVFRELEVFFSRKQLTGNSYKVDASQLKARFYYFLKKFLKSVTSLGYRLIIFLDDLQWADKPSFLLLEELVGKNDIPGLILLTASRPAGDTPASQVGKMAAFVHLGNVAFLSLGPLSRSGVAALIPAHWNFSKKNQRDFTSYLWLESGGNPFRITEILKIIQRENSAATKAEDPAFWENLPKPGIEKDSEGFIREQLNNLPFHRLKVIATAACLGYSFESILLKTILTLPDKEVQAHLLELTKMGLLIRKKNFFVFAHDTIFSAANSLLSNVEKCEIHQKAGIYLLEKMNNYDRFEFFQAVNHLNKANDLAGSGKIYSDEHILLNIQAARLAIRNTAFEIAYKYFQIAEKLFVRQNLPVNLEDPVLISLFGVQEMDPDNIRFRILYGYAETLFLLQKFEAALGFTVQILELNCTRHQRLQATLIKLMICSALIHQKNIRHILMDGVSSLENILAEYGIIIPADRDTIKKESKEECKVLYQKTIGFKEKEDFSGMLNPDREFHDLVNLVATSMTFVYYMDSYKCLSMVSKTLLLVLDKGLAPMSPILFSASFFTGFFSKENRSLAHLLGKFSLKMIEKEPFRRYSYMVHYIAILNFFCWDNHYKVCVKKLEEGVLLANEAGDPHYASFCHTIIRILNSYRGKNLVKHLADCKEVEKDHHVFFISSTDGELTKYLTGERPGFEEGDFCFPEEVIIESEHNLTSRYSLLLAQQKLNYISGYLEAAVIAGENCDQLENVGSGFQIELEHYFFYSLSLLQSAYKKKEKLSQVLLKIAPKLEEFQRLSTFRSGNFLHKVYLIEAEIAKCRGNFEQATLRYEQAVKEAKKQGFVHHAAISAERAFEYYMDKGRYKIAKAYLDKSLKYYTRWGAMAKVSQLRRQYASLITEKKPAGNFLPSGYYETIRKILNCTAPGSKNSLPQLGQYLISLIVKEGKARKGGILLLHENSWKLLAAEGLLKDRVNKPLSELRKNLPVSVLNYSIKKGENIILQDTFRKVLFAEDEYLKEGNPKNISIFPVTQTEETVGLIYLENCLIHSEAEKSLFLLMVELASTTFANAVYYENNDRLNKKLKQQERHRIEAIIESQEKERQRIARELHDSLGQILALAKINLSHINPKTMEPDSEIVLSRISDNIDESCREVRNISHNLMPPDIDNISLPEILEKLINKNREPYGIIYESHLNNLNAALSIACKFTLYRVLQEILQNIIKHASASKVTVSLTETDQYIHLLVEDDGKGFDTKLTSMGLGLKNIYSRVKLLDGYLDIDSSINNGTVFNVSIPINS